MDLWKFVGTALPSWVAAGILLYNDYVPYAVLVFMAGWIASEAVQIIERYLEAIVDLLKRIAENWTRTRLKKTFESDL